MNKKLQYQCPAVRVLPLMAEGMICASIGAEIDPSGLGLGDGGDLSKENPFDNIKLWED